MQIGEEYTADSNEISDSNLELTDHQSLESGSASPEIPQLSPTPPPGKPKIPTVPTSRRASFSKSAFWKPMSRFM
ncbi:hypothetical protein ACFX19_029443 [Malus domestica]